MTAKRPSLTLQILLGVGLPFLCVTMLIGAIAWFSAQDEIAEVYDSQLITTAQELWHLSRVDEDMATPSMGAHDLGLEAQDQAALEEYSKWRSFRVWRRGQVVLASDNAPAATAPNATKGFSESFDGHDRWRVFTLKVPKDGITVEVRENLKARREVSGRIVWGLSLPLLLIFPVIGLAVWAGIRWGLRDLLGFASSVRKRSADDLSPVAGATLPGELTPLSESINDLLARLDSSLRQERLFTDNAAHELRTPLAALGVQAEIVRHAGNGDERDQMLEDLIQGVLRTSHLLDQLLTLARIRHVAAESAPVHLYDVAGETLRKAFPKAHAKRIGLGLDGEENLVIDAKKPLLTLMISNVLDNAIKYTPHSGAVEISVTRDGGDALLTITDNGPGIPEAELQQVFGRFYRAKGNTQPGSGLGLSIVRGIADVLGAEVRLVTSEGQGLSVEMRFKIRAFS